MKYAAAAAAGAAVIAAAYYLPMQVFQAFVVGWLFLIPATFAVYMLLGLREYLKEREHRISVTVKPTEAMRALARKEAELKREKELLYEEFRK
jgi:purine-cytosine permease-like protein